MDEIEVVDNGGIRELPMTSGVERCRRLVVYDGLGIKDAAKELKVTERTVKRWAEEGNWLQERQLLESRKEETVREALVAFALSREMPIANMYYELQKRCCDRLRELVEAENVTPGVLDAVLNIAGKGMDLAERVMRRVAPENEAAKAKAAAVATSVNVPGSDSRNQVQVNILQAASKAEKSVNGG